MGTGSLKFAIRMLVLAVVLFWGNTPATATFYGEVPSAGMHALEFKHGKYRIYLPSSYDGTTRYPLVIVASIISRVQAVDPQEIMQSWSDLADTRGYIVLLPIAGGVYGKVEEWYIDLVKEVEKTFTVDRYRVLLTGFGDSAQFAIYLGVTFPEEFTAVSPVAGTLRGDFRQFMHFKAGKRPQFFFISGSEDAIVTPAKVCEAVEELKGKGYDVQFQEIDGIGHHYSEEITTCIADWFDSLSKNKVEG